MEATIDRDSESHPFTILDADIPFLAVKAAVELDNLRLGKASQLPAVRSLAARLKVASHVSAGGQSDRLFDPPTIAAMRDAIAATASGEPTSIESLVTEAWQIAASLSSATNEPNDLETLIRFCTVLSERATACQSGTYSIEQSEIHQGLTNVDSSIFSGAT